MNTHVYVMNSRGKLYYILSCKKTNLWLCRGIIFVRIVFFIVVDSTTYFLPKFLRNIQKISIYVCADLISDFLES
jgi:hypothetical protein